ncbi:MAG: hypothetical protein R3C60_07215 [Parvularculaceae bacterium]
MKDIAFNMSGSGEGDLFGANAAFHASADHHRLASDFTFNCCFFPNDKGGCANVAFESAIKLDFARRRYVAAKAHIRRDY